MAVCKAKRGYQTVLMEADTWNGAWSQIGVYSGTAYYLLTFDRDAWTGPRTYGNIHWYYAEEFAKGFMEYKESE